MAIGNVRKCSIILGIKTSFKNDVKALKRKDSFRNLWQYAGQPQLDSTNYEFLTHFSYCNRIFTVILKQNSEIVWKSDSPLHPSPWFLSGPFNKNILFEDSRILERQKIVSLKLKVHGAVDQMTNQFLNKIWF